METTNLKRFDWLTFYIEIARLRVQEHIDETWDLMSDDYHPSFESPHYADIHVDQTMTSILNGEFDCDVSVLDTFLEQYPGYRSSAVHAIDFWVPPRLM